ncbi:hypothetical protein PF007_g8611 [Phytophthora fragariae]|uniref:Secreted protein n=1 Tax=Phytophthora fragariae TaxID=53985 RepID=A0A6A3R7Y3_9STRA|nr:hypothetical protein PF003_g1484 [Phytophthora fragariae]KAE8940824.1 hypothetical protein PF009_g9381 [Phytophthora fragariae]KAE9091278.1 hypothetical protein PF006_g24961 [Phytophthora fragariae]KAE9119300.1 hypothetical protein PF007_g8611 [Phytophthora fragariae]KAE9317780.1 hypothetical protein PF001_g6686 [Phytophthora fragariae]
MRVRPAQPLCCIRCVICLWAPQLQAYPWVHKVGSRLSLTRPLRLQDPSDLAAHQPVRVRSCASRQASCSSSLSG